MRKFIFCLLLLFNVSFAQGPLSDIKYDEEGKNTIGRVFIGDRDSMIDESTWIYVKSAFDYYKKTKPAFIILELNTPGGLVFSAEKIADLLKDMDKKYGIPVVALIDSWALSAGALLAYSCRFISIVEDASMGAAEPVMVSGSEMKSASEKINSALRADFTNAALFFDRDPLIAEAMVDKDVILVSRNGKITKLEDEENIRFDEINPDIVITKKGKLLTLNARDMMKFGVADISLESERIEDVTAAEKALGKWPASKSVLFTHPFFKKIPNAKIDNYKLDWKLWLLSFLTKPAIASLLFLGLMLGFYMELNTPGFGLAGSVALACLSLIVLSHFSFEVASWFEVIVILVGLSLLAIEFFVLPGFGFTGILGVILCIAGLFLLMLPSVREISFELDSGTFSAAGEHFLERLVWLSGTLIVGVISMIVLGRYIMPRWTLFQRFVLAGGEETAADGFIAGTAKEFLPSVGAKGEATTALRPAGKVEIDDNTYDVVTRGEFIKQDEKIVVVAVEEGHVIVGTEGKE